MKRKMKRKVQISLMMAAVLVIFGCSSLQKIIDPQPETVSFTVQANAINDKAIADYNNSMITIFQRDAIRSLLCTYQTDHNKKVKSGATESELLADFTVMQNKVSVIYGGAK